MPAERSLNVGRLVLHGRDIRFEKAPSLDFEVNRDERPFLELDYVFEEASVAKEHALLRLKVDVEGGAGGTAEAEVTDAMWTKTRVTGTLRQAIGIPHGAGTKGSIEIDALYDKKAWLGFRKTLVAMFNHRETFSLLARTGKPVVEKARAKR
ncbi:MAG: hypothetical protein HYT80_01790 [Euryarchaeota archaeon]|nr:hypothetical protein [Euryarchaeota archaeon]